MWFFMIMSYIMILLGGIVFVLIGLNHYFSLWPQNHITFDLFASIVFIFAQTLVMFFFVGTGVNVKEYVQTHPENGGQYYKEMLKIKRVLYPPTMMVTVLFMVAVIVDGAFFLGKVSEWWFHIFYVSTLYYFFKATFVQHKSFIGSTQIILDMTEAERKTADTD